MVTINASTTAGLVMTSDLSGTLSLQSNGTTVLTASSTTVTAPSVTTNGVSFPATQVPSADANTLDDYEEGTWTPSVGGTATYSSATGQYVKIGRLVIATFDLTINVIGTGSTNIISGLPFAAGGNSQGQSGSVGYFASLATAVNYIAMRIDLGATSIGTAATTGSQTTSTNAVAIFGNSARLIGTLSYQIS